MKAPFPKPLPVRGLTEEEKREKQEEIERLEKKANRRVDALQSGGGIFDWALGSAALICEFMDVFEASDGIRRIRHAVKNAARNLSDDDWVRFNLMPGHLFHQDDFQMHAKIIPRAEERWLQLLQHPSRYLHMGAPPTEPLLKLFASLGWTGIHVGPDPPPEMEPPEQKKEKKRGGDSPKRGEGSPKRGEGERPVGEGVVICDYINAQLGHESFREFADPRRRRLPKEDVRYPLVYVNHFFDIPTWDGSTEEPAEDEPEGSDETSSCTGSNSSSSRAGVRRPRPGTAPGLGHFGEAAFGEAGAFNPRSGALSETGGLLGANVTDQPRHNLVTLSHVLFVALQRIEVDGLMILIWPACPYHPVLVFLINQLRPFFTRIRIIAAPQPKSFEVYVLFVGRDIPEDEDFTGDGIGYFLTRPHRQFGLDDALSWTLFRDDLLHEIKPPNTKRNADNGYEDLWKKFSEKYNALQAELGAPAVPKMGKQAPAPKAMGLSPGRSPTGAASPQKAAAPKLSPKAPPAKEDSPHKTPAERAASDMDKAAAKAKALAANPSLVKEAPPEPPPAKAEAAGEDASPKPSEKAAAPANAEAPDLDLDLDELQAPSPEKVRVKRMGGTITTRPPPAMASTIGVGPVDMAYKGASGGFPGDWDKISNLRAKLDNPAREIDEKRQAAEAKRRAAEEAEWAAWGGEEE